MSDQSLWGRLPDEIKQEILKQLLMNLTVKFRGKADSLTHTMIQGTKHSTLELRKSSRYLLPNLFLVSKTILNKKEVVDAIVRSAQIRFQSKNAVNDLSMQLTDSQRQVLKHIIIKRSKFLPHNLKSKIGRHVVCLADPVPSNESVPIESTVCVPRALLVEMLATSSIGPLPSSLVEKSILKLSNPSKLCRIMGKINTMMLGLFIQPDEDYTLFPLHLLSSLNLTFKNSELGRFVYASYREGTEVVIEFDLVLSTDIHSANVENPRYRAVTSTKDWMIRATNGEMNINIAQPPTKKFFDEELTENGILRDPDLDLWNWITRHVSRKDFSTA